MCKLRFHVLAEWMLKNQRLIIAAFFLLLSLISFGNSVAIAGKAMLAQHLIKRSWEATLEHGGRHYPWPWADSWPVALLNFPSHKIKLYALSGAHGTSLAFGPGHIDGTALPEESGTKVFSGHRDTHFSFLESVEIGEFFFIQSKDGSWREYRITSRSIVDLNHPWFVDLDEDEVHLITCYPFNDLKPSPQQRYIITAQARGFTDPNPDLATKKTKAI